jgi:sec-independent protein translocase protein TatB
MFDVGFWELVLVGVVALVVIGPKDLPRVARIAGLWLGRARRTLSSVKDEIDREFKAQELKDILEKQARANPLETILDAPHPSAQGHAQRPEQAIKAPAIESPAAEESPVPVRESLDR